jgi:hypothetical protein
MGQLESNTISSAVIQKKNLTVSFKDGRVFSTDNSLKTFAKLKAAIKAKKGAEARKLVSAAESVVVWSEGKLVVDHMDQVIYDGHIVHPKMHDRILRMIENKDSITTLTKFLDNLYQNPRADSINDLYEYLEATKLPITDDGCYLAFKKVTAGYKDCFTGVFDNSVGARVSMPFDKCLFDRARDCNTGFHHAGVGYVEYFSGSRTLIIKVNPRFVTSIPNAYSPRSKARCSEYDVIAEVKPDTDLNTVFASTSYKATGIKRSKKMCKQPKSKPAPRTKSRVEQVHKFTHAVGSRTCLTCGKTVKAKAHQK